MTIGGGCPSGRSPVIAPGNPASRPWPFFDPRREQAGDLRNAGRAQIRPAGGRINPAQVSLAVKLCQRIEECARRRVSRERRGDIVREITALRTFGGQLDSHLIADRNPMLIRRFEARGSTHRRSAGTSLVRIRQPPIVPLTG